jgi:hypothetical protein
MKQFVDQIRCGQTARVEDHGLAELVIRADADEARAHAAVLVADRELGDRLERDPVVGEPEPGLPGRQPFAGPAFIARSDNDSEILLVPVDDEPRRGAAAADRAASLRPQ